MGDLINDLAAAYGRLLARDICFACGNDIETNGRDDLVVCSACGIDLLGYEVRISAAVAVRDGIIRHTTLDQIATMMEGHAAQRDAALNDPTAGDLDRWWAKRIRSMINAPAVT